MAEIGLILQGEEWGDEVVGFETNIDFSFDRYVADEEYAHRISSHIQMKLGQLAKEIQEIGVVTPLF